jgi:hypothetical protein
MPVIRTTAGQLLVNEQLPPELRDYDRTLDKKSLKSLLSEVAQRYPEKYRDISFALNKIGRRVALESGGNSFGLDHLSVAPVALKAREEIQKKLDEIDNDDSLDDKTRGDRVLHVLKQHQDLPDKILAESDRQDNPLARQVLAVGRGDKHSLASLRGMDLTYVDPNGKLLPIPILHSYSEGLSPVEYWAASYGARTGLIKTKFCLSAGNKVLMADYSEKPIDQIKVGDMVMGSDMTGRTSPTRVRRVYENGEKLCYRYKFRIGATRRMAELLATEDHNILGQIRDRKMGQYDQERLAYRVELLPLRRARIRSIRKKNVFAAYPVQGEEDCGGIQERRALLVGLMLGDSCMAPSTHGSYSLSCADHLLLGDVEEYFSEFNLQLVPVDGNYNCVLSEINKTPRRKKAVGPNKGHFAAGILNETRAWLRYYIGECLAHEKTIPDGIWSWDNLSVRQLLGGLFSTDGNFTARQDGVTINFAVTSPELALATQKLLELRLGIWTSTIRRITPEKRVNAKHDLFWFSINHATAIRKFADLIPLVGKKRLELANLLPLLKRTPRNSELAFKVFSKEPVGNVPTYDIEVENDSHLFVLSNGLIVSNSTADAGYLSKRLSQAAHRLVVTAHDEPAEDDTLRGMPSDTSDEENEGSLLASATGGYPRNTILTPKILADLRRKKVDRILVRSPIVGGAKDGGLLSHDVGVREHGTLAQPGSLVGLTASQALSEPLSQGQLSSKHAGGVAGSSALKSVSGFDLINQLVEVPKTFRGGATHSQHDGTVQLIADAPAGGKYIVVDGEKHYVPTGAGLKVKKGDTVEAGDVLSEGIPNPAEIVRHKGVGEGRRYFAHQFREAFRDAGISAHRRNAELMARGLIDHVRLNEEHQSWLPNDVVSYQMLEHQWEPRDGSKELEPRHATGKYLEKPVLHYTVGTKVRPSVQKDLDNFGVKKISVHDEPPPFEPAMIRGSTNLHHDPDWLVKMYGSGLKTNLLHDVHRGATSDEMGTSFVPSLAKGTDFGLKGKLVPG